MPGVLNRGSMNALGVHKGTLRGPYEWIRFCGDKRSRFLAKVGTLSFRSRPCDWVDLQKKKKKGHHLFLVSFGRFRCQIAENDKK